MIGQFGPEGGILCCEDSDFILEIPPGAIPPDRRDQLIIARISLCPDSIGPKLTDPDSLWLGPLVELESPGLDRFHKNVKIRLPHRARLQPGWTFSVHYTDPTADTKYNCQTDTTPSTVDQDPEAATFLLDEDTDTKPKWNCVEQKWHSGIKEEKASKDVTRVTFTVDENYVNILSSHFSEYVCSGCSKTHPLNLEAVVFWQHYKAEGLDQMDLKVYIIDIIKDTRKVSVESNERSSKQVGAKSGMTAYSSLSLEYTSGVASSLGICVDEECMGDDRKWSLKSYNGRLPAKRVMSVESVIRGCCSSHLSTREMFTFVPRDPSKQLSFFQAMVCISQPNSPEGDPTPILVTVPLTKGYAVNNNNKVCSEGQPISDDQMDFVGERLPCSKWPTLYRKLIRKGANKGIEEIKLTHPNNPREQIQCALVSWRSSNGRMATVEQLITALQQAKLEDLADELLSYCQDDAEGAEEVSTPTDTRLVMETHL
ncbi:uncharacterized protein LOC119731129 [Patiria miniata]|uniref:Death domain-containing protein n=1 Tax=Patiria miniata TaxID=46514 RepID=A0A914A8D4_PATMI|nr:uncharacterized protein LOC119731129 [Patiria miniata]